MQENNPLKNRFENFSAEPRPEVWNRIEAELDNKPKRRFVLWWWSAAALLIIGIGTIIFMNASTREADKLISSQENSDVQVKLNSGVSDDNQTEQSDGGLDLKENATVSEKSTYPSKTSQSEKSSSSKKSTIKTASTTNVSSKKNKLNSESSLVELEPEVDEILILDILPIPSEISNHSDSTLHENKPENQPVLIGDSPFQKTINDGVKLSRWSVILNGGIYRTSEYHMDYSFAGPVIQNDLSSGIPVVINESFQNYMSPFSRSIAHSIGADLAYSLSCRWQLRTGFNLLMYRTKFGNENFTQRGSNYFQLAFGADYSVLQIKRFKWQIGTGIGTGLLRNQTQAGVENHWRSEWNLNTALSYSINSKIAIRVQPTSRVIISDTQVGGFGKLSKWYHGGNIGVTWNL